MCPPTDFGDRERLFTAELGEYPKLGIAEVKPRFEGSACGARQRLPELHQPRLDIFLKRDVIAIFARCDALRQARGCAFSGGAGSRHGD